MGFLNLISFVKQVIEGQREQIRLYHFIPILDSFTFFFIGVNLLMWVQAISLFSPNLSMNYVDVIVHIWIKIDVCPPTRFLTYEGLNEALKMAQFSNILRQFIGMHYWIISLFIPNVWKISRVGIHSYQRRIISYFIFEYFSNKRYRKIIAYLMSENFLNRPEYLAWDSQCSICQLYSSKSEFQSNDIGDPRQIYPLSLGSIVSSLFCII